MPSTFYNVRSHSFIEYVHHAINIKRSTWSAVSVRIALSLLYSEAVRHAENVCNDIFDLCHCYDFGRWASNIIETTGFLRYSTRPLKHAARHRMPPVLHEQHHLMMIYLNELAEMTKTLESVRVTCVLEHCIDISQPISVSILEQETSDSCETDDDDDEKYAHTRKLLDRFRDRSEDSVKTEPLLHARHRKDVRAWARMYRYGCMKLACGSMLVYKDKNKLPKRRRKSRQSQLQPQYAQLQPQYDQQIWDYREDNVEHSSASSYRSSASMQSDFSNNKKRRLPRNENGYSCDFPGCEKSYHRKCDLSHHQRCHRPKDTLPYPCERCGDRFPFPKDLRRHEETHFKNPT